MGFFRKQMELWFWWIDRKGRELLHGQRCEKKPVPEYCKSFYEGSVWFMNFRTGYNNKHSCNNQDNAYIKDSGGNRGGWNFFGFYRSPVPGIAARNKACWEISAGPFDCRTWRQGNGVNTFRTIEPDGNCYTKLATFTRDVSSTARGLNVLEAFNIDRMIDLKIFNKR